MKIIQNKNVFDRFMPNKVKTKLKGFYMSRLLIHTRFDNDIVPFSVIHTGIEYDKVGTYTLRSFTTSVGLVQTFNSCTKCVGSAGIIHDRTPDCHRFSLVWMHG